MYFSLCFSSKCIANYKVVQPCNESFKALHFKNYSYIIKSKYGKRNGLGEICTSSCNMRSCKIYLDLPNIHLGLYSLTDEIALSVPYPYLLDAQKLIEL